LPDDDGFGNLKTINAKSRGVALSAAFAFDAYVAARRGGA
jgi:hypothetical protein